MRTLVLPGNVSNDPCLCSKGSLAANECRSADQREESSCPRVGKVYLPSQTCGKYALGRCVCVVLNGGTEDGGGEIVTVADPGAAADILKPFRRYCRTYIDDIVIFSRTHGEHLAHLDRIFQLLPGTMDEEVRDALIRRAHLHTCPSGTLPGQAPHRPSYFGAKARRDDLRTYVRGLRVLLSRHHDRPSANPTVNLPLFESVSDGHSPTSKSCRRKILLMSTFLLIIVARSASVLSTLFMVAIALLARTREPVRTAFSRCHDRQSTWPNSRGWEPFRTACLYRTALACGLSGYTRPPQELEARWHQSARSEMFNHADQRECPS